uniref:Conserved hypothethical protein n=1 Tax=Ralstonia solanacearum TaxID=305 RepID=A0A0S4VI43_RALSL|nr:Conserved hypothethical protein [Ralstonia solanacearum]CUV34211.1 Conserved hypothethical protein [Ralstonia solanacearum]CUV61018.1 Conserved hypothethical protein [Ralstonia solanacearum]
MGGQGPARQQDADDKFATNARLCCHGLPVAACGRRHRAGQRPTRCCRCAG